MSNSLNKMLRTALFANWLDKGFYWIHSTIDSAFMSISSYIVNFKPFCQRFSFITYCYEYTPNRFCKGFYWSPFIRANPLRVSSTADAINLQPFTESSSYRADSDMFNMPRIKKLFLASCPSAIFRAIIAVIVNTFNCQRICVSLFGIVVKLYKRIFPCIAYTYASPSIVFVNYAFRIVTALFHICPYCISSRLIHSVFLIHNCSFYKYSIRDWFAEYNRLHSIVQGKICPT